MLAYNVIGATKKTDVQSKVDLFVQNVKKKEKSRPSTSQVNTGAGQHLSASDSSLLQTQVCDQ